MSSFNVIFKQSAERDLRKIDKKYISKIIMTIENLILNPFPKKATKLIGTEATYRIRVGSYRIIYQIEIKSKNIYIYHIRHRRDAYKNL